MLFVKNDDLKVGMRLAKPIYNKKGVLLYERDSKLTTQGIDSVKNFGLIGLYILEPAEPVPPMSEEDIEFERFQTVAVFQIQDELTAILSQNKTPKMRFISADIIKHYGRLTKKINFVQNLRSNDDYVYKHSLNTAMLVAMMTHVLNVPLSEQEETVIAGIVHAIGKLRVPKGESQMNAPDIYEREGFDIIDGVFSASPNVKRTVVQAYRALNDLKNDRPQSQPKTTRAAKVLMVAETFDTLTAMNDYREPSSEVAALRYLQQHPEVFDPEAVAALVKSINFLTTGCTVELNNGDKGLVIAGNDDDVLHPMVLSFTDNSIIDLARQPMGGGLEIKDVMKTLDNRCVVDKDALKSAGVSG